MKQIIASVAAAGILVVGAFAASTITSSEASAQTDDVTVVTDEVARPHPGAIVDDVLDDLVEKGTLRQDQADAVKDGLAAKHEELKEKFGDRRDRRAHRQEMREQVEAWLADGVITADELTELDVELPIFEDGPLAEALEDGEITQAEWDAFIVEREANHEARRDEARDSVTG
jgi:polyhydroxyalkanoate synthesis regulator phasin